MPPRTVMPEHYHALAEKRGFTWIEDEVKSTHAKTRWQCSFGHTWEARYNDVHKGKGCPYCAGLVRKTEADYRHLAAARGFVWVGDEAVNVMTKTRWQCSFGHTWEARYNDVHNRHGCPYCSGNVRKSEDDYRALAIARGFAWLGNTPPSTTTTKTTWQCPLGHTWEAIYSNIERGSGCPHCSGNARKTEADYRHLAAARGFVWVDANLPPATNHKTSWRCSQGHKFLMPYANLYAGQGCPHCANRIPKTHADYCALAQKRGFIWVGELPSDTKVNTRWQCPLGHTWEASYHSIQSGNGCPNCFDKVNGFRVSKPQRAVHDLIGGELNYRSQRAGRYCIDIALDTDTLFPIAIEYDCWYWHQGKKDHDAKRDQYLLSNGWNILHIRGGTLVPSSEDLHAAISRLRSGERFLEITLPDWKGD
jgi:very-short-patch-repair endonuclease